jgi:hypothetical protein
MPAGSMITRPALLNSPQGGGWSGHLDLSRTAPSRWLWLTIAEVIYATRRIWHSNHACGSRYAASSIGPQPACGASACTPRGQKVQP